MPVRPRVRYCMGSSASLWDAEHRSALAHNTEHCSVWQGGVADVSVEPAADAPRRRRADAAHNSEALLRAARVVFARSGVDAPAREIAAEAGVGVGTLYRHFPHRAALVAAVFTTEIDATAAAAAELLDQLPPGEALDRWVERFTRFV